MSAAGRPWRKPDDVRAAVRRRWANGTLLRAYALSQDFEPISIPLGGPRATEIGDRLAEVQDWASGLETGSRGGTRYDLEYKDIGGRAFGRNRLPAHAVVSSYAQAWALLDTSNQVATYVGLLAGAPDDSVREWLLAKPVRALGYAEDWEGIVTAYRWLEANRGSGRRLRQIDAPGVDTKFVEDHRSVLAELLGVSRDKANFLRELGLGAKPEYLRLRLSPQVGPTSVSELTIRVDEVSALGLLFDTAVIVENETTFLTIPPPKAGIVILGSGFDVARLGRWEAIRRVPVHYWGDLDTHGFAILHRLRTHLPDVRSFHMDSRTLLAHRSRWGREAKPTSATLTHLTPAEAAVYDDLVSDRYGDRVRLEQERIDWTWVTAHLPYAC